MTYNAEGAANALQKAQRWIDNDQEYLHALVKVPNWQNRYGLHHTCTPPSWRLVDQTLEEKEEIIFTLQGVLEAKFLPPVLDNRRIQKNKAHLLHQSVTISGLGTPTFNESLDAIAKMMTVFARYFPEGQLAPWEPSPTALAPGRGLFLSNRHFTWSGLKQGVFLQAVPFPSNVDPHKVLEKLSTTKLVHTEDNEVKYYTRFEDMAKKVKYIPANPQVFRVGDLVEVQFSLVIYKMRTQQFVLKPMLYSIALLDGGFANELALQSLAVQPSLGDGKRLKRRIGYPESSEDAKKQRTDPGVLEGLENMTLDT